MIQPYRLYFPAQTPGNTMSHASLYFPSNPARSRTHLSLLHGVKIEVEALEVYDEVVREGLDGAPFLGAERHRLALA